MVNLLRNWKKGPHKTFYLLLYIILNIKTVFQFLLLFVILKFNFQFLNPIFEKLKIFDFEFKKKMFFLIFYEANMGYISNSRTYLSAKYIQKTYF